VRRVLTQRRGQCRSEPEADPAGVGRERLKATEHLGDRHKALSKTKGRADPGVLNHKGSDD